MLSGMKSKSTAIAPGRKPSSLPNDILVTHQKSDESSNLYQLILNDKNPFEPKFRSKPLTILRNRNSVVLPAGYRAS